MRIGCDIDGCLADFCSAYAGLITRQLGINFPPPSETWPRVWHWDRAAGVTPDQEKKLWREITTSSTFWRSLDGLPGAGTALRRLEQASLVHQVYFITTRPGFQAKQQTEAWLVQHGYEAWPTVLISGKKGPVAMGLELDVFIDDKPENCEDVADYTTELDEEGEPKQRCKVFLVDAPYNRINLAGQITRVKSVCEALTAAGVN